MYKEKKRGREESEKGEEKDCSHAFRSLPFAMFGWFELTRSKSDILCASLDTHMSLALVDKSHESFISRNANNSWEPARSPSCLKMLRPIP